MNNEKPTPQQPSTRLALAMVLVFIALSYVLLFRAGPAEPIYEIPYSEFKLLVRDQKVLEVQLSGEVVKGQLFVPEAIGPYLFDSH